MESRFGSRASYSLTIQMMTDSTKRAWKTNGEEDGRDTGRRWSRTALGLILMIVLAGCEAPAPTNSASAGRPAATPTGPGPGAGAASDAGKAPEVFTIRESDVLKVSFPGAPNLETTQQVRRDGRINLPLVGEVVAAGKTPKDLEKELIQLYSSQLVSKEVNVTLVSSTFAVFVSGAVLRPGRIVSDRPLTLLEAVMEAGGVDPVKANPNNVVVIRQSEGNRRYNINLKAILEGRDTELFYLKPSDVVIVPEKFSVF